MQHIDVHDMRDAEGAEKSAVDFSLDVTTRSVCALLFAVCHGVASTCVSFENSPSRGLKLGVVRRTGLRLPANAEPGPTEVGPVRPTIILMRKRCDDTVRTKNRWRGCALRLSAGSQSRHPFYEVQQKCNLTDCGMASGFLCVHDDHSVRQQFVQQGVGGGPAVVEVKRRIIADVHLHRDVDVFRDHAERHVASVA